MIICVYSCEPSSAASWSMSFSSASVGVWLINLSAFPRSWAAMKPVPPRSNLAKAPFKSKSSQAKKLRKLERGKILGTYSQKHLICVLKIGFIRCIFNPTNPKPQLINVKNDEFRQPQTTNTKILEFIQIERSWMNRDTVASFRVALRKSGWLTHSSSRPNNKEFF